MLNSEQFGIGSADGYFGVSYYRLDEITKTAELVIAHRGTCFNEVGNVLADLSLLL